VHYVLVNGAFALDDQSPTYTLAGTTIRNQDAWRREEGPQPPRGRRRPRRVLTSMAPAGWPVPHRVGSSLALAYIDTALSEPGTRVAVEILDEKTPATVVPTPYYDPKNTRVRA